ncbi:MAG: nodulation protein NfeD [Candidatus Aminicenantes bacterium]|nr:nodulation protein NfeD [Candidatus Aminicenantes bacterium]
MSKRLVSFIILLAAPLCLESAVWTITVDAAIHPVTSEYIRRSLDRAESEGASLFLIALNTPGGLDSSMREIIERILKSEVPVAVYVSPSGGRAASAGFLIGLAADLFVMAPGTSTGAAHPVGISAAGQEMDDVMSEKITQDAASFAKTLAEKRGRNVRLAEEAVTRSRSYTETEALSGGLIDLVAKDIPDLLGRLEGRAVRRFDGGEDVLHLAGQEVQSVPMSGRQKFLLTISNPNLAYLLLMIGLLGLYFEFANPGAILPGVLGALCLLLAIFSFQILPINYVGLILILLALGLFALEVKVHSYGLLSAGGVIAMVIGSIMLIDAPIPELRPGLRFIIPVALAIAGIFLFLVWLVVRTHRGRVHTGHEGLAGETGTALTDLNPEGRVFVHGEYWRARAEEPIARGTKIVIIGLLDGMTVRVGRKEDRAATVSETRPSETAAGRRARRSARRS